MNPELKALLDVAFDGLAAVEDGIARNYFDILGDMGKLVGDAPGAVMSFGDLQVELAGMRNPANQADLVAYIEQKFSGAASGKVQKIVAASLVMVENLAVVIEDGIALKNAIVS